MISIRTFSSEAPGQKHTGKRSYKKLRYSLMFARSPHKSQLTNNSLLLRLLCTMVLVSGFNFS